MWPLLACSLLALAVIIERVLGLRHPAVIDPAIVEDIQKLTEAGELKRAIEKHQADSSWLGRAICRGLA